MTIKDLLLEKDMADLAKEFNAAKAELRTDVDVRITLDTIKSFVVKWEDFTKEFTTSNKRITVITEYSDKITKYLQSKIDKMSTVMTVEKTEITPLQNYLDDFKTKIKKNLDKQKQAYNIAMTRR